MHLRTLSAVVLGLGMTLAGKAQTSLPYSQSFNTEADFNSFTFTDANADGFSWFYDNFNYEIGCERNMYADADDWLFSPVFHLQAGIVMFRPRAARLLLRGGYHHLARALDVIGVCLSGFCLQK